jgi:hypothetical protein
MVSIPCENPSGQARNGVSVNEPLTNLTAGGNKGSRDVLPGQQRIRYYPPIEKVDRRDRNLN